MNLAPLWSWLIGVFLPSAVTTTLIFGVLGYLGRSLFENWLKRSIIEDEQRFKERIAEVERKFKEQLANDERDFKRAQDQEIEAVRHRFSALVDRKIKLNNQEFEILPRIWLQMSKSYGSVGTVTSRLRTAAPNVANMDIDKWKAFVGDLKTTPSDESVLLASTGQDRQARFELAYERHRFFEARLEWANNALIDDALFIPDDIMEKMRNFDNLIQGAVLEREINFEMGNQFANFKHADALSSQGLTAANEIREMIQSRLWKGAEL
jgi:hypothetical protein